MNRELGTWNFVPGLAASGVFRVEQLSFFIQRHVDRNASSKPGVLAASITIDDSSTLFAGLPTDLDVWMSHGDHLPSLPPGFRALAHSKNSPVAAMERGTIVGIQFHPEVVHTPRGKELIQNFVYRICGCKMDWTMGSFIEEACRKNFPEARILRVDRDTTSGKGSHERQKKPAVHAGE